MQKIYKIVIDTKEDHNFTKKDVIELQNILKGNITQIGVTKELCKNFESHAAGIEYCNSCKANNYNLFAISEV